MPDEEALSEEDLLTDAGGDTEEIESFVTDFMDEAPEEDSGTEAEAHLGDVPEADEAVVSDEVDEDDEGISVFAYTRAPVRPVEEEDEFDRDNINAAVMRLRGEERKPEQPMSEWGEDE